MSEIKLFNKWPFEEIEVTDLGLKPYINLKPLISPKTGGKYSNQKFHKSKMNIVERLINKMMVSGHKGKKHVVSSGRNTGKSQTIINIVKDVFEDLEKRAKENPIKILVLALENASLREEITSYQMGGVIVRKAVITSPQRRLDSALTIITRSAYKNDASKSEAIKEKERIEREASVAR